MGVEIVGGAIAWLLKTTKVESLYAATVIFLGQRPRGDLLRAHDHARDRGVGRRRGRTRGARRGSENAIGATARGALNGGRIALIVGCLLIAFISLIALANGLLGGAGELFGYDGLMF